MKTAEQILRSKSYFRKELNRRLSKEESEIVWRDAEAKLCRMLEQYRTLPKGVHRHTDTIIFPAAAIYLAAAKRLGRESAFRLMDAVFARRSLSVGKKLAAWMRIPGMKDLFVRLFDPVSQKMFGRACGFSNVFYPNRNGEYRMDVTACPYFRYLSELGCPELTRLFCANDIRIYGNLPGIVFERSGTLGTGAKKCDFRIRKE